MVKRLLRPTTWLPLLCFILEFFAMAQVISQRESSCVEAQEIDISFGIYIVLVYPFMMPDLFLVLLVFFSETMTTRPFLVVQNGLAVLFLFVGAAALLAGLTFCGNIAQPIFLIASILTLVSAVLHGILVFIIRENLPDGAPFAKIQ